MFPYFQVMNKKLFPGLLIVLVAVILLILNSVTDTTFFKDYALIFIIGGMFLGYGIARWKP
ncbi:MAG: hypothetical protein SchgKO_19000 [Schleiferiaceae bacterium]